MQKTGDDSMRDVGTWEGFVRTREIPGGSRRGAVVLTRSHSGFRWAAPVLAVSDIGAFVRARRSPYANTSRMRVYNTQVLSVTNINM